MFSRAGTFLVLFAALLLIPAAQRGPSRPIARATSVPSSSDGVGAFLALAPKADAIVTVTLVSKRSYWNPRHDLILTDYTLRTTSRLVGEAPAQWTVVEEGGEVGEIGLLVSDGVSFQPGATYALLLTRTPEGVRVLRSTRGVWQLRDAAPLQDPILGSVRTVLAATGRKPLAR